MKHPNTSKSSGLTRAVKHLITLAVLLAAPLVQAANYYLDVNGTTAGFGSPSGNYNISDSVWTTSSAGTTAPGTYPSANGCFFGAAASDLNGSVVTVNYGGASFQQWDIAINSTNASVTLTNSGGNVNLGGGNWSVATGSTLTEFITWPNNGGTGLNFNGKSFTISGGGTVNFKSNVGLNSSSAATITENMVGGVVNMFTNFSGTGNQGNFALAAGTLNFATASSSNVFNATGNAHALSLNGGTIDNTSGAGMTVTIGNAGSSLNIGGNFTFTGSSDLRISAAGTSSLGTAVRTVTVNSHNLTLAAPLSGAGGGITKAGTGTLTLSGNNSYTGATTVSNGTLLVTGSIASGSAVSVTGSGILGGSGTVNGVTFITNNGTLAPRPSGGSATTLTFGSDLTITNNATNSFTLSTSGIGANDKVIYGSSGTGTLTLDSSATINITCTTLDVANDYVLFTNTVGGATVSMTSAPTLQTNGVTVTPAAGSFVITNYAGSSAVVLHYIQLAAPATVNSQVASPNSLGHHQTTTVTVNVTPSSGANVTNLTVTLDELAGAGDPVSLTGPGGNGSGNWTGTFTAATSLAAGSYSIGGLVQQNNGASAAWTVSVTVTNSSSVWSGSGADNKWSTVGNWNSNLSPGPLDYVFFAGTTKLINNLDASLAVGSLTFNSGAGSFDITNAASTLTLAGGLTNNSTSAQTLDVPVVLTTTQPISAAAGNITINPAVSDSGSVGLTKEGNGILTLSGANTYTGNTTINAGTLTVGGAGQLAGGNYLANITNNGALVIISSAAQTLSGLISGSGAVVIGDSLTISSANTYGGGTTITNAGQVSLPASSTGSGASVTVGPLGTGAVTLSGGTLQLNGKNLGNNLSATASTTSVIDNATTDASLNGDLSGGGTITLQNSSGNALSGHIGNGVAVNWSGFTGTLNYSTAGSRTFNLFAPTVSDLDLSNATVNFSGSQGTSSFRTQPGYTTRFGALSSSSGARGEIQNYGALEVGNLNVSTTFGGFINQAGSFTKVGTGSLTLSGGNSFAGGVNLNGGVLCVSNTSALGSSGNIVFGGGTLQYSTANQVDYSARIASSASPISIDPNGNNVTFATALAGSNTGGLVVTNSTGTGTLTLTGASSYAGDTVINAGTLALSGSGTIGSSANIIVAAGAKFDVSGLSTTYALASGTTLSGGGTVVGTLATTDSSSAIQPGGGGTVGTLTFQKNLDLSTGAAVTFDISTNRLSGNDQIVVATNLTLSSSDTIHINALSGSANLALGDYVLFSVGGNSALATQPSLVFDNTPPANSSNYSIQLIGKNVVLHYSAAGAPVVTSVVVTNTADGSTVGTHGQSATVYVVVQPGNGSLSSSSVTADLSVFGGSAAQVLNRVNSTDFDYTFVIGPNSPIGPDSVAVTVTDSLTAHAYGSASFTVNSAAEIWSGLAANNNWGSSANWASSFSPGYIGDSVTFTGSLRTSPNLETNYNVAGITFDGSASSFTNGSTTGKTLTLSGPINNSSANPQVFNLAVNMNGSQTINAGAGITFAGPISGSGVDVTGGTVILAGTDTYTGNTTISGGALKLASSAAIPSGSGNGSVNVASGTLDLNGTNASINGLSGSGTLDNTAVNHGTLTVGNADAVSAFSGTIQNTLGALTLVKVGTNTLTVTSASANTYSGGTTLNAGTLAVGDNNALGSGSVTLAGGRLMSANLVSPAITNAIVVTANTTNVLDAFNGNLALNGNITGSGTLTRGLAGVASVFLGGDNSGFTGVYQDQNSGNSITRFSSASAGSANARWIFNQAQIASRTSVNFGTGTIQFGSISGNGYIYQDVAGTATLEVGALGLNDTFGGSIQNGAGILGLTKVGSGTLTLTGAKTYTGNTVVSNGTLIVNGSLAAGSSVTVEGGTLSGIGSINGATTVNAGAYLKAGTNSIGTLTINSNLTLNAVSTNSFVVSASGASNNVVVAGTLTPNGSVVYIAAGTALGVGTNRLFTYGTISGAFNATPVFDVAQSNVGSIVDDGVGHISLVMAPSVNLDPATANFAASITGSAGSQTLNFTWAPDHKGWQLYTNAVGLTDTGSWFPVPGSASVTNESITVDPTKPNVFFQLRYP